MTRKLVTLLTCLFAFGLSRGAEIKVDSTTPEGAILLLEEAYKKKDIEAAVVAQDFFAQANLTLSKLGKGLENDADLLKQTAEVLELSFRALIKKEGFPNFEGLKSRFTQKKTHPEFKDMVEVTEICTFPDGGESIQKVLVAKSEKGWRFVIPVE